MNSNERGLKGAISSLKKLVTRSMNRKNIFASIMVIVILGLLVTTYKINEINTRAFAVYYGDAEVGEIRKQEEALDILNEIKDELSNTYEMDIVLNKEMTFEETHVRDEELSEERDIKEAIESRITFLVCGYMLKVDGVEVFGTKTKEEIEAAMEEIKKPYLESNDENTELKEIDFLESVEIIKENIPLNKIVSGEELLAKLRTGTEETKIHRVEVGESFWTIAKIYDMNVEDLEKANPDKDPGKLQIGDEVKLVMEKPMVTVVTTEEVRYKEKINYEVKIEEDKNMYNTEKKVKVEGEIGENEILAKLVKQNGVEVEREIVEENTIKEARDELVVKGTKEVPRTVATGVFLMPTRGSISSRYGMRNGRMHKGLDIAARTGTDIKAADGGKVVFTGRRGAYGNLVEIDHGNGYKTRYAHCSSIIAKNGQRVAKGEVVAKVGNTGRSTGPHLHFEIIKNGSNQNPASYVN